MKHHLTYGEGTSAWGWQYWLEIGFASGQECCLHLWVEEWVLMFLCLCAGRQYPAFWEPLGGVLLLVTPVSYFNTFENLFKTLKRSCVTTGQVWFVEKNGMSDLNSIYVLSFGFCVNNNLMIRKIWSVAVHTRYFCEKKSWAVSWSPPDFELNDMVGGGYQTDLAHLNVQWVCSGNIW